MSRTSQVDVLISEVGPREGQQAITQVMPTEVKNRWIAALADSGIREIEATSFVSPKAVPQMADAAEVLTHALRIPDLQVLALVPNLRGAQRAAQAGATAVNMPVSASRLHSMSNIRMTPEDAVNQVGQVVALRNTGAFSGGPRVTGP